MIIDFHSHIFPDKIANSTISSLKSKSGNNAYTDGTVDGLINSVINNGADISITLPVLTKPTQFDSVSRFIIEVNERFAFKKRKIISFGGIHPLCDDIYGKMKFLKDNGVKGVKIHPDYQSTYINDQGYIDIINSAKELDMIVVTHSGVDEGYKDRPIMCPPELVKQVINKTKWNKFVLAHYGGNLLWNEVYDTLAGLDVYFDTAVTLGKLMKNCLRRF